jgi:hypothetical protein
MEIIERCQHYAPITSRTIARDAYRLKSMAVRQALVHRRRGRRAESVPNEAEHAPQAPMLGDHSVTVAVAVLSAVRPSLPGTWMPPGRVRKLSRVVARVVDANSSSVRCLIRPNWVAHRDALRALDDTPQRRANHDLNGLEILPARSVFKRSNSTGVQLDLLPRCGGVRGRGCCKRIPGLRITLAQGGIHGNRQ